MRIISFLFHRHPELVSGSIVPHARHYRFQTQPHRKILPMRVVLVDKVDLPRPVPVFQPLLPPYRRRHIGEEFEMNKAIDCIFGRVTWRKIVAMLIHALGQIRRHSDVGRAIQTARKDIDTGLLFFSHCLNLAAKWTLKQVQGDGGSEIITQPLIPAQRHPELVSGSIVRLGHYALGDRNAQCLLGGGKHHD
jgi:hypothetical protein